MNPEADVYQGENLVAHLERTNEGTALHFIPNIDLQNGFLATSIPYQAEPIQSTSLPSFFLNLLPEGARLELILQAARNRDDFLELLLKLGWDTIGDVAVVPHGAPLGEQKAAVPQSKLSEVSFWDLFYQGISERPDAAIPGVQEKISSSTIAFGIRTESTPSAILKLNPTNFPNLVQNEEFFLRMARACGLEANKATLVHDRENAPGLLVTRFDRVKEGKSILKFHQEDACQLLNTAPSNKYHVAMRDIADALQRVCTAPTVEILRLLQLYAFSYIIGNGDLHAKNISVLWTKVVRLSPAYDLLSTLPYPMDQHMALPLDGKNDNFRAADFTAFGERFGVPKPATETMVDQMCALVEPWIFHIGLIGFDEKTTERMQQEVATRIRKLLR